MVEFWIYFKVGLIELIDSLDVRVRKIEVKDASKAFDPNNLEAGVLSTEMLQVEHISRGGGEEEIRCLVVSWHRV